MQSTRLVSLAQRSVAAIEYVVEAIDEFVRVTVQSELVANEDQPERSQDPRVAAVLQDPLEAVRHETTERGALLVHKTRVSGLMMAAAMDHDVEVPGRVEVSAEASDDLARTTVICGLRPGQQLRIVKYLAYGWSSLRSRPALRDQVAAAHHRRALHRLAGSARLAAGMPRRLLGLRRCRGGGRSRLPAGGAVRAVSRAAVQRARRTPGDTRKGPHRHRLRRACLLGHRRLCASGADLHRTHVRPPMRCDGGPPPWTSPGTEPR